MGGGRGCSAFWIRSSRPSTIFPSAFSIASSASRRERNLPHYIPRHVTSRPVTDRRREDTGEGRRKGGEGRRKGGGICSTEVKGWHRTKAKPLLWRLW